MNEILQKLLEPFPPSAVSWKPGQATKDGTKCMAMAYGDLRAYQERLDEVCDMDWGVAYEPWGEGKIICRLTIAGVTRSSTGEHNAQDEKNNMAGTVAEAQAFKRAAAMFGLGRYLYDLPSAWVAYDAQARKISKEGQADLDKRYLAWYSKTMAAQRKAPTTPQTPVAATKQPAQGDEQLDVLNGLGEDFYGKEWATQGPALAKAVSKGATEDVASLSPQQAQTLIEGIRKKMDAFQELTQSAIEQGAVVVQ